MPGVRELMELRRVPTEADDDSTASLDDFRGPMDVEKSTIARSANKDSNVLFLATLCIGGPVIKSYFSCD